MIAPNGNENEFGLSKEDHDELVRRAQAEGLTLRQLVAKLIREKLHETGQEEEK
jgi:predicted HicB family RNase H-like nuclease